MKTLVLTSQSSGNRFNAEYKMYHPATGPTTLAWYQEVKIKVDTPHGEKKASYCFLDNNKLVVVLDYNHKGDHYKVKMQTAEVPAEILKSFSDKESIRIDLENGEKEMRAFLND